jgi:hypothetical protein
MRDSDLDQPSGAADASLASGDKQAIVIATTTLLRAAEQSDPAEQVRVIQEEYTRQLHTPGFQLGPRLKTGQ